MAEAPAEQLRELVSRLEALARRRSDAHPRSTAAAARAARLLDHLAGHVRVRAASLDAPLLVLILGPTGAGKSTLFNTIAGRAASQTGVLRPTTRTAVVLVHPDDRTALVEGPLARIEPERLRIVEDATISPGVALVDAPDVDSIEHANRDLADRLVEAADLCLFVTTATRYADRVPWTVLGRIRERGLPLNVVVNRMPPDPLDQAELLEDVARLFAESGLSDLVEARPRPSMPEPGDDGDPLAFGDAVAPAPDDEPSADGGIAGVPVMAAPVQLVGIPEGTVVSATESLEPDAIAPIAARVAELRGDRDARIELAARALTGSLAGLGQLLDEIADDCEHEAIDVDALHRGAGHHYERGLIGLREELGRGRFLREEALRQWHDFVGADQMTRFFAEGIGRVRGAIAGLLRPATPPVAEVRAATTDDLLAVARMHAAESARRTATSWADVPSVGPAVAARPELWSTSPDFDSRLRDRLAAWIAGIGSDIQATGRPKRVLARGASLGVNALGTGVMLGTFMHTGGLTGAEVGVAAGTAFLNHKLLSALFGEAAMAELIANARRRLDEALATTFAEERARFDALVPGSDDLTVLAAALRDAAREVRALPVGLPPELRAVMAAVEPAVSPPSTA
jgi:energy-coupling factor transporter ATP-binding protein EcfA2